MARVNTLLPTFSRGEVSPLMVGRSDLEQYSACLNKSRNCWIRPYGVASRMAGTEYITTTKAECRFIKFVFSATDSYMIEVGAGYFRFMNNGAVVTKTSADAWITSTAYVKGDYVEESSTIYYCLEAHTSGTFATDLAANKWVAQEIYEVPNSLTIAEVKTIQYVQLDDILKIVYN